MDHGLDAFLQSSPWDLLATSNIFEPSHLSSEKDFAESLKLLNSLGQITKDSLPSQPQQAQATSWQPGQSRQPALAKTAPASPPPAKPNRDHALIEALLKLRESRQSLKGGSGGHTSIIRPRS